MGGAMGFSGGMGSGFGRGMESGFGGGMGSFGPGPDMSFAPGGMGFLPGGVGGGSAYGGGVPMARSMPGTPGPSGAPITGMPNFPPGVAAAPGAPGGPPLPPGVPPPPGSSTLPAGMQSADEIGTFNDFMDAFRHELDGTREHDRRLGKFVPSLVTQQQQQRSIEQRAEEIFGLGPGQDPAGTGTGGGGGGGGSGGGGGGGGGRRRRAPRTRVANVPGFAEALGLPTLSDDEDEGSDDYDYWPDELVQTGIALDDAEEAGGTTTTTGSSGNTATTESSTATTEDDEATEEEEDDDFWPLELLIG